MKSTHFLRSATVAEREIEAECTAFLVCNRNGVTVNSEAYLSSFVDAAVDPDQLDIYQIMRAAGQIETVLDLTLHTKLKEPDANQLKLPF